MPRGISHKNLLKKFNCEIFYYGKKRNQIHVKVSFDNLTKCMFTNQALVTTKRNKLHFTWSPSAELKYTALRWSNPIPHPILLLAQQRPLLIKTGNYCISVFQQFWWKLSLEKRTLIFLLSKGIIPSDSKIKAIFKFVTFTQWWNKLPFVDANRFSTPIIKILDHGNLSIYLLSIIL